MIGEPEFRVTGYRAGRILVQTVHSAIGSMQVEVEAWKSRLARGECDRVSVEDLRRPDDRLCGDQTKTILPKGRAH